MESVNLNIFNRVIRLAVVFLASIAFTTAIMMTLEAHAVTGDALDKAFKKAMVEHDDARQSYGSNAVADRIDFHRVDSSDKISLDLREADVAFEEAMKEKSHQGLPVDSLETSRAPKPSQQSGKPAPVETESEIDARI